MESKRTGATTKLLEESPDRASPEISIVICSHRREFLLEAVDSALNQTLNGDLFEVVVVLDYQDISVAAALTSRDVRYQIINGAKWGEAMAYGTEIARGSIICLLDDDDRYLPQKLSTIREYFARYPDVIFIHNSSELLKPLDARTNEFFAVHKKLTVQSTRPEDPVLTGRLFRKLSIDRFDFNASSISIRRSLLLENLALIKLCTTMLDSILFYISLAYSGKILGLPDILTEYRIHESVSHSLKIDPDALRKYVEWSTEINRSLGAFVSNIGNATLKDLVKNKMDSTEILAYLFNTAELPFPRETFPRFLKTNISTRPTYTLLIVVFLTFKRSIFSGLFRMFSVFIFRLFVKAVRTSMI